MPAATRCSSSPLVGSWKRFDLATWSPGWVATSSLCCCARRLSAVSGAGKASWRWCAAKSSGGGRSHAYSPTLIRERSQRARLADELRGALTAGQITVHYQPIVAALDGGVLGVEALVRWQHPQRGLLAPAAFLSVAAEPGSTGVVGVLGMS